MNFDDTARYLGPSQKLWPELFAAPSMVATKLCRRCHKVAVQGIRRYCTHCALKRKLASTCKSKWAKRRLNGRKTENSPIEAEALTKAEMSDGYDDTQKRNGHGFSSARQETALPRSEVLESRNTKEIAES
jgi:hypothetical protein